MARMRNPEPGRENGINVLYLLFYSPPPSPHYRFKHHTNASRSECSNLSMNISKPSSTTIPQFHLLPAVHNTKHHHSPRTQMPTVSQQMRESTTATAIVVLLVTLRRQSRWRNRKLCVVTVVFAPVYDLLHPLPPLCILNRELKHIAERRSLDLPP